MAVKIFHKDHGYVITADQAEIDMLLAKGGEIVTKDKKPEIKEEVLVVPKTVAVKYGKRK